MLAQCGGSGARSPGHIALGCGGRHIIGVCGRQDSLMVKKGSVNHDPNTTPLGIHAHLPLGPNFQLHHT